MQLFHFLTAVTHMDWHFGMVLKALEATGQADDTIVTMTGGEWGWFGADVSRFIYTTADFPSFVKKITAGNSASILNGVRVTSPRSLASSFV